MTTRRSNPNCRRGIAMLAVLVVSAVAAVVAYALLSSSAIQSQIASNTTDLARAAALADSGVHWAMHCLRHPGDAPALVSGTAGETHYGGGTNVALLGDGQGFVDLAITNPLAGRFIIESTGRFGEARRTLSVLVQVDSEYRVPHALALTADVALPSTVIANGTLRTDGNVALASRGNVRGPVYARNYETLADAYEPDAYPTSSAPAYGDLLLIRQTAVTKSGDTTRREYYHQGRRYWAEQMPAVVTGTLVTADPVNNPANVWFSTGSVTMTDVDISGTLVFRRGVRDVTFRGTNTVKTKVPEFPAMIVRDDLLFASDVASHLDVHGVLWIGDDITTSAAPSSNCSLVVHGGLLMPGVTATINPNYAGPIIVHHDEVRARASELSISNRWPVGIRVLEWDIKRN